MGGGGGNGRFGRPFEGKYAGKLGLGMTLAEVDEVLGGWHEDLDTYELDGVPGLCFELDDMEEEEEWDELIAPITAISVYNEDYEAEYVEYIEDLT